MDPSRLLPGPWPALTHATAPLSEFDPAGPLWALVLLPLAGALAALLAPSRLARFAARVAVLWTLPGVFFLGSALVLGGLDAGLAGARWLERGPGGGGLVLSAWNLVPAFLVAIATPIALLVPEPRSWEPARSGWLLALAASTQAAILAAGPGTAALGWMGGAWAVFFLLGHEDAAGQGRAAIAPFATHAAAAVSLLAAGLDPFFLPALVLAGLLRLGVPPFHGVHLRAAGVLPTGALLLVGVCFTVTGLAALADGILALESAFGGRASSVRAAALVACAVVALWGGLLALAQEDLKQRWAGFLMTQAALWAGLLVTGPPAAARAVVGPWAVATLFAFITLAVGFAPLWAFARTGDLRAYGGLWRLAPGRAALLVAAATALAGAPFVALPAAGAALVAAWSPAGATTAAALVGGFALGLLAFLLTVYRALRGAAPAPIPAPGLGPRDLLLLAGIAAALVALVAQGSVAAGLVGLWPTPGGTP